MDNLDLNPEALEATAQIVEGYCFQQIEIMDRYLDNINSLRSEWDDDRTIGSLVEEIAGIRRGVQSVMEQILGEYPAYFRRKAELIRMRPTIR